MLNVMKCRYDTQNEKKAGQREFENFGKLVI